MNMMIIASIVILAIILLIAYKGLSTKQPSDSALRQRAVFNTFEYMTFIRMKEILPQANIFAHVSFDALLTTKFPRTRRKYENLFADFVVLDKDCHVIAVVALGDVTTLHRSKSSIDQDALLDSAGYRVIRYDRVPEYQQLRDDFLGDGVGGQGIPELEVSDINKVRNLGDYADIHVAKHRMYG
ncbi:DUF2726 domain-containing protein [Acinetobacter sp. KS-LM10]|uniref:DUF2726 domain-containing protein n=1 Tax=Acinetobacter sp. KS-LM10 TaxID=3120518 RepID=UPI0030D1BA22